MDASLHLEVAPRTDRAWSQRSLAIRIQAQSLVRGSLFVCQAVARERGDLRGSKVAIPCDGQQVPVDLGRGDDRSVPKGAGDVFDPHASCRNEGRRRMALQVGVEASDPCAGCDGLNTWADVRRVERRAKFCGEDDERSRLGASEWLVQLPGDLHSVVGSLSARHSSRRSPWRGVGSP